MTQTLRPIRQQTDVTLRVTLTDNGVRVSWLTASDIKAFLYSERQKLIDGMCTWEVDGEDDTVLVCHYGAHQPQHLGKTKIIIEVTIAGQTSTYDKYALEFVENTDDTENDGTTVEDEVAEVDIDVTDVDTTILTGAIAAALAAAVAANEAAAKAEAAAGHEPYIGDNGNWYIWNPETGQYEDSGKPSQGDPGFTFTPTTDPEDEEYRDEYQRILAVLYQALTDAQGTLTQMTDALAQAAQAIRSASQAASSAETQALAASGAANDAEAAAILMRFIEGFNSPANARCRS